MLILAKRGNIKWPPMNKCSPFLRFKSAAIVDGGFSIYASIAKLGILQCSSIWLGASPQKDRLRKRTLKCLKANQDWSSTVQDRDALRFLTISLGRTPLPLVSIFWLTTTLFSGI